MKVFLTLLLGCWLCACPSLVFASRASALKRPFGMKHNGLSKAGNLLFASLLRSILMRKTRHVLPGC